MMKIVIGVAVFFLAWNCAYAQEDLEQRVAKLEQAVALLLEENQQLKNEIEILTDRVRQLEEWQAEWESVEVVEPPEFPEEDPGEEFIEEDPGEEPVEEDPWEEFIEEDPGEEPVEEDPGEEFTEEDPGEEFTEEDPGEEFTEEDPGEEFTEEDPGEEFTEEDPGEEPAEEGEVMPLWINIVDTEDPVAIGQEITYVVQVINVGETSYTNICMEDTLPGQMEFVSAEGPTEYKVEKQSVIFEPIPILGPKETAEYKIVCRTVREGAAVNVAQLLYDQFNGAIFDEERTEISK